MKRMVNNAEKANNLMRTSFVLPDNVINHEETLQDASKSKEGQILINFCNEVAKSAIKIGAVDESIDNIDKVKNYPIGTVTTENSFYLINVNFDSPYEPTLYSLSANSIISINITYDREQDVIDIRYVEESFISDDNVKTLFGQTIIGNGDITMYRHQMTITNANDVSVVYIVDSANNLVVNTTEKFVTVTKATTSYTGLASYLDASGDVQPAFIRYSAGNVIVQLQNGGISPMKSISDIVTPI